MKNVFASGWHMIVDAVVDDARALSDVGALREFLRDLTGVLRMQILVEPQAHEVPLQPDALATDDDEGGITGFCVITTSHIAIHTWPLRHKFSMDVFSCKPFERDAALDFIVSRLGVRTASMTWIDRTWPAGGEAQVETRIIGEPASALPTSLAA